MKQSISHKLLLCSAYLLCAGAGIAGAYLLDYLLQAAPAGPAGDVRPQTPPAASAAAAPNVVPARERMAAPAPHSSQGTSPFSLDLKGNLLVDDNTESILDGFLATLPSEASAAQRRELETRVGAGLPQEAASRAVRLMRAYIAYRKAFAQLPEPEDAKDVDQQREAANARIALRRRYFDKESAGAMFGSREALHMYSIEVAGIASDKTLDAEARAQGIKSLHAALPAGIAAMEFNRPEEFSAEVEARVALLRLSGAPDQEIRHARHQYFGIGNPASIAGPD